MTTTHAPIESTEATATTPIAPATVGTLSLISLIAGLAAILFGQPHLLGVAAIVLGIVGYKQEPWSRGFSVWGTVLGAMSFLGWFVFAAIGLAVAAPLFWISTF
jgi:hypothetical protein